MSSTPPEVIRTLSLKHSSHFRGLLEKTLQPRYIEVGQIWSTFSSVDLPGIVSVETKEPKLVVVLNGAGKSDAETEQVVGAPISLMTWAASDFDLILPENESSLGYRCMIEIWNETPILKASLKKFVGKISDGALRALKEVFFARVMDEALPDGILSWVGIPLSEENDARRQFQEEEIASMEYLAIPASASAFANLEAVDNVEQRPTSYLRYILEPKFVSINSMLKSSQRAFAASEFPTKETIIQNSEGEATFIFEILERRNESRVYLLVHDIAPSLKGRKARIILSLRDQLFYSEPTSLEKEAQISMGIVPNYNKRAINQVIVEIEE